VATSRGTEATSVPGRVLLDGQPGRRPEAADPDRSAVPATAWRRSYWRTNGWCNGSELWAATHLEPVWTLLRRLPVVRSVTNRLLINRLVYKLQTRPNVLSTMTPYTSWESLTDRTYSARHLQADDALQQRLQRVAPASVAELFRREQPRVSGKSTLLFSHFAQWFVDGFLRTDPDDVLRNTSTHDIDLSQLYGQTEDVTALLRTHSGGRLKSQQINGGEFPPYYFGADGQVKPEFANLPLTYPGRDRKAVELGNLTEAQRRSLFALGIPRGNIHYGFVMLSTLFLREHNRLADLIAAEKPDWDDEHVFQTARNTLIVILIKIVIEDYINHITPFHFKLFVKPGIGVREKWYRQNWMSIEFDLLYRWHPLVPTDLLVGGVRRAASDVLWETDVVPQQGLASLFDEASRQPSTEIGIRNTAEFLLPVEERTIAIGRAAALAGFNDYRRACGYPRLRSFRDFSADPEVASALADRYGSVDDVEMYVGLFAEDVRPNSALPMVMGTMVAVDAFSQALTNPLLAKSIFNTSTFSRAGKRAIARTSRLQDLVDRNTPGEDTKPLVTFTRTGSTATR
jgi:prostaglandin-endoperoxide synthase 2